MNSATIPTHLKDFVRLDLYDFPALYDALLSGGAHIPFYRDLAHRHAGEALELACGTGQLTVPIASAGVSIVGLDISPPMLNTARERAAAARPGDL
jgi:ubiquinone/menaquinone biosynthesis C-methylase UbiE